MARIPENELHNLVRDMELERLVLLLNLMEVDDETDVIGRLPDQVREQVLSRIHGEDREHVEELLGYPEDSAGGIMSPLAFRLREEATCREAIDALQDAEELESVFYLFVENEAEQLVGVTSLRNLLTHPPGMRLKDFMTTEVITVHPEVDQEEVARVVGRYDLLAIPVVDDHRKLLGIVTVDDIIDVIKEEAAEDMMLMAGVHELADGGITTGVLQSSRERVLWLLATLGGGIVASESIALWSASLETYAVLAGFLPVVLGMGGNVGTQSATITVRGIALGRVQPRDLLRLIWRELRVGFMLGLGYGLLLGIYCLLRFPQTKMLGLGVAGAIFIAMTVATSVGAIVPLTLERMHIDPAVATNPIVTTLMDNIGVIIYFSITTYLLAIL